MKNRVIVFCLFAASAACALTVPQTSEATIHASPLARGEVAYIAEDGGATAYVGSDVGPLRVSDPATLHGSRLVPVSADRYTIVPDSSWTTVSNGFKLATQNVTARLVVTSVDGAAIANIRYRVDAVSASMMPADMAVAVTYNGSTVILDCRLTETASYATITDITPQRYAFADRDAENDLTATKFMLHDSLGDIDFGDLRRWARDLYNGNRGEDWAAYPATKPAKLAGQPLRFDAGGAYVARVESETNLALKVNGYSAMEFLRVPGTTTQGSFTITSLDMPGDHATVTIGYTTSILGFDYTLLRVKTCDDLREGDWTYVDSSRCTATADTVTITGCSDSVAFFKLDYDGVASEDIKVVFRAPVTIESALYLRGEDNVLYKITVNAGAITATAQTE